MTDAATVTIRPASADDAGRLAALLTDEGFPAGETDLAARIVTLVVDPGVRERGIGKRLMADAERVAREGGAAVLEVTSGHHRPEARKLFESIGYDAGLAAYLRKRP